MTSYVAETRSDIGGRSPNRTASIALAVILICQIMVVLDATIVTVALPKIRTALDFSATGLSWVQNAYALTFGGLLLLGARAGDILGRRRTLVAGIALFSAASLLGGLAQSETWLLSARALQGVGAAIASPATLALLTSRFPEGPDRLRALGLFTAVSAGGASVGLVAGGMLTDWASWRWALLVNVPIGLTLILLAPRYLPETEKHLGRFDLPGALTSTVGVGAIVYGFVRAGSDGWRDAGTIGSFVAGVVLLALFVRVELSAEQPITPLRLLTSRERNASLIARLFMTGAMFGMFFFLTQYLQGVLDYSPLQTGFAFVPMTAVLFVSARLVLQLMAPVGARRLMIIGSAFSLVGMLWLTRLTPTSSYLADIVGPMVIFGIGAGMAFLPLTSTALAGVPPQDAGAASGLVNVMQQVGGAVGLAILVTVFGTASRDESRHSLSALSALARQHHDLANAVASAFIAAAVFAAATFAVIVLAVRTRAEAVAD
jgi:EmrB/QacA subfamily drug resistance transporter